MKLYLRDLTDDKDVELDMPYEECPLTKGHEYIIQDTDDCPFNLSELDSIDQANVLLKKLEDSRYTKAEIDAIGSSYLFSEVQEAFEKSEEPFEVIEIESFDDEDCGYELYENGISYLPFEVPEEAVDYIRWEQNWFAAESDGWRKSSDNHEESLCLLKKY